MKLYRLILDEKPKNLVNIVSEPKKTTKDLILKLTPIGYTPIIPYAAIPSWPEASTYSTGAYHLHNVPKSVALNKRLQ